MEMFIAISTFYFSYRLFQIAEACNGRLSPLDVIKAYLRKLIRIAPVYWAIFLLTWGLYPRAGDGPNWYLSESLFETCHDMWWTKFLMIGNIIPWMTPDNSGCFFWGWIIEVDVQLCLLVPIFVYCYLLNRWFGNFAVLICALLGMTINMAIVDKNDFKVGWLSLKNYTILAYLFEKPWNHIASMCCGVFFA